MKLKLFITSNFTGRSTDMYIAEYWMDQLFGASYGDGRGDISHYLTDEVTEAQMDEEVARLRKEYV